MQYRGGWYTSVSLYCISAQAEQWLRLQQHESLRRAVRSHALFTAQSQLQAVCSENIKRKINIPSLVRIIFTLSLNAAPQSGWMRCGAEFILSGPSVTLTQRSIPRRAESGKYLWRPDRPVTSVQVPSQCCLLKLGALCGFRVSGWHWSKLSPVETLKWRGLFTVPLLAPSPLNSLN